MDKTPLDHFLERLEIELRNSLAAFPERYAYKADNIPRVIARYRDAIPASHREGTYHLTGLSLIATCRYFGIKVQYRAIYQFCFPPKEALGSHST